MFLMFQLGRLDVWPVLDFGVRSGFARMYRLDAMPSPKQLRPRATGSSRTAHSSRGTAGGRPTPSPPTETVKSGENSPMTSRWSDPAGNSARLAWCGCGGLLGLAALCVGALMAGGPPGGSRPLNLASHERSSHPAPVVTTSSPAASTTDTPTTVHAALAGSGAAVTTTSAAPNLTATMPPALSTTIASTVPRRVPPPARPTPSPTTRPSAPCDDGRCHLDDACDDDDDHTVFADTLITIHPNSRDGCRLTRSRRRFSAARPRAGRIPSRRARCRCARRASRVRPARRSWCG